MLVIQSKSNPFIFWLITHIDQSNNYVVYKITTTGVFFHGSFQFGPNVYGFKNMAYSSVRNEIAFVSHYGTKLYVCQFDANTGNFLTSAYSALNFQGDQLYDIEYSPSGNFLYYVQYAVNPRLWQYNLSSGQSILIETNSIGGRKGGLKIGPDGYIYHISKTDMGRDNYNRSYRNPGYFSKFSQLHLHYQSVQLQYKYLFKLSGVRYCAFF